MRDNNHKGIFFELNYGQNINIDLKDKKIISILSDNCRIPATTIAKIIHSSKGSVNYRIEELIKKDVYRKNITIINPFILGFPVFVVLIKLKNMNLKEEARAIDFFEGHPFIIWFGETQGNYDFNISIAAKDIHHFDKSLKQIQAKLGKNIKEMKILNIKKLYNCDSFPLQLRKELNIDIPKFRRDSSFNFLIKKPYSDIQENKIILSLKEIVILKEIANDAGLSLQEISERTGIKRDTVKNIIIGLINKNVILAFRGIMNASFLKFHGYILYFKLTPETKEKRRKEFEEFFRNSLHTAFGTETSGSYYDCMIYLFSKTPLELNSFIKEVRNKFSDIIEEYSADLILKDYKLTFFPDGLIGALKNFILKIGAKFS